MYNCLGACIPTSRKLANGFPADFADGILKEYLAMDSENNGVGFSAMIALDIQLALGGNIVRGDLIIGSTIYPHWWIVTDENVEIDPIVASILAKNGTVVRKEHVYDESGGRLEFNRSEFDKYIQDGLLKMSTKH